MTLPLNDAGLPLPGSVPKLEQYFVLFYDDGWKLYMDADDREDARKWWRECSSTYGMSQTWLCENHTGNIPNAREVSDGATTQR